MDENFAEVEPESVNLPHRARAGKIEGALLKTMNLKHFVEHLVEIEPSIWPPLSHLLPIPRLAHEAIQPLNAVDQFEHVDEARDN